MQLSRDTKRFFIFLASFTVGLVLCVSHIGTIGTWLLSSLATFSPFIVGACMAFIISVPMRLFSKVMSRENKKGKALVKESARKPISLVFSILFLLLLLALFSVIVVPQLVDTVASLASSVMLFVPTAQRWITEIMTWLEKYPEIYNAISPLVPDLNQVASSLIAFVHSFADQYAFQAGQKTPLCLFAQDFLRQHHPYRAHGA